MPSSRGASRLIRGGLTPISLFVSASESNGGGTANLLTELPTGAYPTTPSKNTLIFDAMNYNGNGAGWTGLVPGQMEQQPGSAYGSGSPNAAGTNTVGFWGRFDQIVRARRPTDKIAILPCMQGSGRFSDTSPTRGRLANWDPQFNDGAYNCLRTMVAHGIAGLTRLGYVVTERIFLFDFAGNDAIQGSPVDTAWYNKAVSFIDALYRDGIIAPGDRIIFNTLGVLLTGSGGIPNANRILQNNQIANLVALDPANRSQIYSDGQTPMTALSGGTDAIHLTAAGHWAKGEEIGWEWLREWRPVWENMNGGAAIVLHEHDFGGYRNLINSSTLTTGALQTLFDLANAAQPTQATGANQPAIGARTLANGLNHRFATGNGTSSALISTVPTMYNRATSVMSGVIKGASQTQGVPFAEGGVATNTPLADPFYNASGVATFLLKNDAGTVVGATSLGSTLFDSNWNQFLFVDNSSTARLDKNGVAGTPITSTRGTFTPTTQSFFCQRYNNNTSSINFSTASIGITHEWSQEPSAAVKVKLANFYRFWHGSN